MAGNFSLHIDLSFLEPFVFLFLGKYYIYVRKCYESLPSLTGFIARISCVYNIELHIARE